MKLILSFSLLLLSAGMSAQTTPAPTSVNDEIVVTASAVPDEVDETPATATIVTREEIERRESRDILEVLREVPGLTAPRTGSPGKTGTLFIRGGSSKQSLILWNGVEVNDPFNSGYNFGQLSAAGVEKIEIVRGPFSALYGSEAVSGVVNVLTTPSRSGGSINVAGGERGLLEAAASGAYVTERWNVNGSLERRQDDGFASNDDFELTYAIAGATLNASPRFSIGLMARRSEYELGIPFAPNAFGTAFVASPDRREDGVETQLVAPIRLTTARIAYELRLSSSTRDESFADPNGTFGPEFSITDSKVRSARGTATSQTAAGMITIGAELDHADVDHDSVFNTVVGRERESKSLFAEDRYSRALSGGASLEVSAGVRYDDFDTFGSELSPRVAAAWVRDGHKFRAAYGEGFRAPGIGELYSPGFGNPLLDPEQSQTFEVGYERYVSGGSASVTLFSSDYEDLIFFASDFKYRNIAAASSRGVELALQRSAGPFHAALSYTWLDAKDESTDEQLVRRPKHSGSLALGYDFAPFMAQLVIAHTGERLDVTDLLPYGTVTAEAFTTADLAVHYRAGAFAPYVKIENLTDTNYEAVFGYPSAPRRVVAGVRYTFNPR